MALLAEYLRPHQLFERVVGSRRAQGVRIVTLDVARIREADEVTARRLGAAAIREVLRILKSGGAIALAMDRDLIGNGERFTFFGAEAPIPVGVVDAAMRAGSAILPVVLPRVRGGVGVQIYEEIRYDRRAPRAQELHRVVSEILAIFEAGFRSEEIRYDRSAPRAQELHRVVSEILAIFEAVIRKHPEQWHVLDPIWKM